MKLRGYIGLLAVASLAAAEADDKKLAEIKAKHDRGEHPAAVGQQRVSCQHPIVGQIESCEHLRSDDPEERTLEREPVAASLRLAAATYAAEMVCFGPSSRCSETFQLSV